MTVCCCVVHAAAGAVAGCSWLHGLLGRALGVLAVLQLLALPAAAAHRTDWCGWRQQPGAAHPGAGRLGAAGKRRLCCGLVCVRRACCACCALHGVWAEATCCPSAGTQPLYWLPYTCCCNPSPLLPLSLAARPVGRWRSVVTPCLSCFASPAPKCRQTRDVMEFRTCVLGQATEFLPAGSPREGTFQVWRGVGGGQLGMVHAESEAVGYLSKGVHSGEK